MESSSHSFPVCAVSSTARSSTATSSSPLDVVAVAASRASPYSQFIHGAPANCWRSDLHGRSESFPHADERARHSAQKAPASERTMTRPWPSSSATSPSSPTERGSDVHTCRCRDARLPGWSRVRGTELTSPIGRCGTLSSPVPQKPRGYWSRSPESVGFTRTQRSRAPGSSRAKRVTDTP